MNTAQLQVYSSTAGSSSAVFCHTSERRKPVEYSVQDAKMHGRTEEEERAIRIHRRVRFFSHFLLAGEILSIIVLFTQLAIPNFGDCAHERVSTEYYTFTRSLLDLVIICAGRGLFVFIAIVFKNARTTFVGCILALSCSVLSGVKIAIGGWHKNACTSGGDQTILAISLVAPLVQIPIELGLAKFFSVHEFEDDYDEEGFLGRDSFLSRSSSIFRARSAPAGTLKALLDEDEQ
ncbi:hypothetical protein CYMTET_52296 [Cymbomonas tetramitiformis]|uniref:Uncharacterized protein n=1 Tax=Cymbomonas tetramitiformis TaxID=36881 RepID=A0AAE0BKR8_9CHLO|nr:hypothetical protein CYMTET_52296 [Cymbomonas tetramitiformis]